MQDSFGRPTWVHQAAASARNGIRGCLAAIALLATVACSATPGAAPATSTPIATRTAPLPEGTPPPAASPAPQPAATPPAYTSAQAVLGAIVWTTAIEPASKAPLDRVAHVSSEVGSIYVAVPVIRLEAGTVVVAEWTYNDTPVAPLTSRVTAEAQYEDAWIAFHITQPANTPWPDGTYRVTILVDEEPALTSAIEVVDAGG